MKTSHRKTFENELGQMVETIQEDTARSSMGSKKLFSVDGSNFAFNSAELTANTQETTITITIQGIFFEVGYSIHRVFNNDNSAGVLDEISVFSRDRRGDDGQYDESGIVPVNNVRVRNFAYSRTGKQLSIKLPDFYASKALYGKYDPTRMPPELTATYNLRGGIETLKMESPEGERLFYHANPGVKVAEPEFLGHGENHIFMTDFVSHRRTDMVRSVICLPGAVPIYMPIELRPEWICYWVKRALESVIRDCLPGK